MIASTCVPWPLAVIDYEASSLDDDSYPIEVGVAVWRSIDQPVVTWSSLIRPEREWRLYGHWSRVSQKIHGIVGTDLSSASDADTVVAELCAHLDGIPTIWCDGGPYDTYWNNKLFGAANRPCPFRLGDWHRMLTSLPAGVREAVLGLMEKAEHKHRAADDAASLIASLAAALALRRGMHNNSEASNGEAKRDD